MEIKPANEKHLKEYVEIGRRAYREEPWSEDWDEARMEKRFRGLLMNPMG
ncbi:MAG: hypothetical protein IJ794_10090 [Lachnospiraceae bacterium]|nr:hypothetical protein [Lachnospiraceae bacterium]